jgi:hypothetical protein
MCDQTSGTLPSALIRSGAHCSASSVGSSLHMALARSPASSTRPARASAPTAHQETGTKAPSRPWKRSSMSPWRRRKGPAPSERSVASTRHEARGSRRSSRPKSTAIRPAESGTAGPS